MQNQEHPEIQRLRVLQSLELVDTPGEERFDRITRLAARVFGVAGAVFALADESRFWFKSKQGTALGQAARTASLCEQALHGDDVLVVQDTALDERAKQDPFARGEAQARFFAGVALKDADGRRLGVLCIFDPRPRELGVLDLQSLRDLGALLRTEMFLKSGLQRRDGSGRLDAATGTWNRDGTYELLQNQIRGHLLEHASIAVISMRVDNLHELGAGRPGGSELVMGEVAQIIRRCMRSHDGLGRISEETFLVMLFNTNEHTMSDNARRICHAVASNLVLGSALIDLRFGVSGYVPGGAHDADELVKIASRDLQKPTRLLANFPTRIAG
jgi:diguanylate cyclase (GGDEF)-like protein